MWKSGQTGNVTRVASGCAEGTEAAIQLKQVFREQIQTLPGAAGRFHLHLTPGYSTTALPGSNYKFFNKPFGLRHWMEEGLGFPENLPLHKDTIFIILDPDQLILRPFVTANYTNDAVAIMHGIAAENNEEFVVKEGRPFAQIYNFSASFIQDVNKNVSHVVRAALDATASTADPTDPQSSHLYSWTAKEVQQSYLAGTPYMAVTTDMYKIVKTWAAIVVPVYELTQNHLSEMFAYSAAAAHLQLPHQLVNTFMVGNPAVNKQEGWNTIDTVEPEHVCQHVQSNSTDPDNVAWTARLPHTLHYCQMYSLGPYFFFKYYLPDTFLSCEHPLLVDPVDEQGGIAASYNSSVAPDGKIKVMSSVNRKRHAFLLCHTISRLNDAATYWKEQHCQADAAANFNKSFRLSSG